MSPSRSAYSRSDCVTSRLLYALTTTILPSCQHCQKRPRDQLPESINAADITGAVSAAEMPRTVLESACRPPPRGWTLPRSEPKLYLAWSRQVELGDKSSSPRSFFGPRFPSKPGKPKFGGWQQKKDTDRRGQELKRGTCRVLRKRPPPKTRPKTIPSPFVPTLGSSEMKSTCSLDASWFPMA